MNRPLSVSFSKCKVSKYISKITVSLYYNHREPCVHTFWRDVPTVDALRLAHMTKKAIHGMSELEARLFLCKWEHMTHLADIK